MGKSTPFMKIFYFVILTSLFLTGTLASDGQENKAKVELFVMSLCPYGGQAENTMEPVYYDLKENISFKPHYIIEKENGNFSSLHGQNELEQNKRELCVLANYSVEKWFDFVTYVNDNCESSGSCWEEAANSTGLNESKIQECAQEHGKELLGGEYNTTKEKGVSGSPTMFIDGKKTSVVYDYGHPEKYKEAILEYISWSSLQERINNASDGDVINITNEYIRTLRGGIVINKSITLVGGGLSSYREYSINISGIEPPGVLVNAPNVTIRGFRIKGTPNTTQKTNLTYAIRATENASGLSIEDNYFNDGKREVISRDGGSTSTRVPAEENLGVLRLDGGVGNVNFADNTISYYVYGILGKGDNDNLTFKNNYFYSRASKINSSDIDQPVFGIKLNSGKNISLILNSLRLRSYYTYNPQSPEFNITSYAYSDSQDTRGVILKENDIEGFKTGIKILGSSLIKHNRLESGLSRGIVVLGNSTIKSNIFERYGRFGTPPMDIGIKLGNTTHTSEKINILDNEISGDYGILIENASGEVGVLRNDIRGLNKSGILVKNALEPKISKNRVSGGKEYGIRFKNVSNSPEVHNNSIQGGKAGIRNDDEVVVNAQNNYWGEPTGPRRKENGEWVGNGDKIIGKIKWQPYYPTRTAYLKKIGSINEFSWSSPDELRKEIEKNREKWKKDRYEEDTTIGEDDIEDVVEDMDNQKTSDTYIRNICFNLLDNQLDNYATLGDLNNNFTILNEKLSDLKSEMEGLGGNLKANVSSIKKRVSNLKSKVSSQQETIEQQNKTIQEQEQGISELENKVENLKSNLNETLSLLEEEGKVKVNRTPTGFSVKEVEGPKGLLGGLFGWLLG